MLSTSSIQPSKNTPWLLYSHLVKFYIVDNDYIYWIDSGHSITRINRDLTERKTIVSGLISAKDLTIDPQGGTYFTYFFSSSCEVDRFYIGWAYHGHSSDWICSFT